MARWRLPLAPLLPTRLVTSLVGLGLGRQNAAWARLRTWLAVWSAGDALFRAHAAPLQESHEQHTIKQLLRLVQELTAERDEAREKLRAARQGSGSEAARQEIETLQKQNVALAQETANMYSVIDQNRALTALLEELQPSAAQQRVEGAESLPRGHAESARGT